MKRIIPQISFGVLLLSTLIYGVGRWVVNDPISDDTGDWFLWSGGLAAAALLFTLTKDVPQGLRRGINITSAIGIVFLVILGAWGLLTPAGQLQFPEMAGMIPYLALAVAAALAVVAAIANLIWRQNK